MDRSHPDFFFVTYRHFRPETPKFSNDFCYKQPEKLGAITACCKVFPNKKQIHIGYSFCAPEDCNQFCKKTAREYATKRLIEDPIILEGDDYLLDEKNSVCVSGSAINHLANAYSPKDLRVKDYHSSMWAGNLDCWLPYCVGAITGKQYSLYGMEASTVVN